MNSSKESFIFFISSSWKEPSIILFKGVLEKVFLYLRDEVDLGLDQ